ncbi:thiamine pyrophosphate-binding protein [Candidatus Halocynthiibacter alkanivorans]|uniref:thiamine pyrophosphate-binding protein n=1 Tax=Candidatus Halocynthiibacter alkanivorans TaxID=2267619 RepID=UPI000DF32C6F|nr:thiamine pyrophosphate-binding protein [Candidatus Halocynthiibacter alkanivorans]
MTNTVSSRQSASEVIAERLYQAGCRHAFGIPGGEVLAMMDALDVAGLKITLVKHENSGGFMAEGTWHHDGAPGVLFATIGPGIANAANVIANAWQDRVPMIVLTGCVPALEAQTYTHQVFDHVKFLEPVSKAAFRVEPGTAGVLIDKAINIATSGRPGPVLLDVPVDVQREMSDAWYKPRFRPQSAMAPAGADLDLAQGWLRSAKRPLLLAGVDVLTQSASDAVARFCVENSVPLITTYKAKGVLDEAHALSLGGAGLSPLADKILLPLIQSSDCLILAGYDPVEMRIGWRDLFAADQNVIDISAERNSHYMHQAPVNFTGDIAATLSAIGAGSVPEAPWPSDEIPATKSALQELCFLGEVWGPAAVVDEARKASPAGTVATVDSGAHRIVLSHVWQCDAPHGLLQSSALCTMGCAVPLAIGRKIAEPDRPVIAFVGDAGVEMFLGELATARDHGLGIPVVVFVDEQLGLIELKQRGSEMRNLGVEFPGTDFTAVAVAMGGAGVTCHDRASLNDAIQTAYGRNTFTLISAVIGRNAYDGRI